MPPADIARRNNRRHSVVSTAFAALLSLAACNEPVSNSTPESAATGGDFKRGARAIAESGCGACHRIPGITGAAGLVGPPLDQIGRRIYLAGRLRNTPDNMMMWLREPQSVVPGNAMPNMGVTEEQARNIAAYLYTLQ